MAAFPMFLPPQPMHPYFSAAPGGTLPFYQPQYYPGTTACNAPKPSEQAQQAERASNPAEELATMSMKIAGLESDLNRCLAEKTVTRKEKRSSRAADSSVAKMQVAVLEKELTRTKKMNIALKAKLSQTQTLLYRLTSMGIDSKGLPSFKPHETSNASSTVSSDAECLIDLLEPHLSPSSTGSGEDTTAVEASTAASDYSKEDSEEVVQWPTATTDSFSSISSSSSYIQHFVKKPQDHSPQQATDHKISEAQDTASVGNVNPSANAEAAVVDGVDHANNDHDGCGTHSPNTKPGLLQPALDKRTENEIPHHKTWNEYMHATNKSIQPHTGFLDNRDVLRGNLEENHQDLQPSRCSPTPKDQGRLSPPNLTNWARALLMKGRSLTQEIQWSPEVAMARHGLRPRCDFYQSNSQCEQAMELHYGVMGHRTCQIRGPGFFRYGIRYIPRPIDENVLRTVLINGLPDHTTALDLLQKVRGGLVLNAQLVQDPTKGKAALIIFLDESAATAYAGFAAKHPIKIHGMALSVRHLSTPTWPTPHSTLELITNAKATRCFEVSNMRQGVTLSGVQEVLKFPGMTTNGLECSRLLNGTTLQLRFISIQYAIQAYEMYQAGVRRWLPDPCAQPVETLLNQEDIKPAEGGSEAT